MPFSVGPVFPSGSVCVCYSEGQDGELQIPLLSRTLDAKERKDLALALMPELTTFMEALREYQDAKRETILMMADSELDDPNIMARMKRAIRVLNDSIKTLLF